MELSCETRPLLSVGGDLIAPSVFSGDLDFVSVDFSGFTGGAVEG